MKSQWCQFDSQIKWNRFEILDFNFVFPRQLLNLDLQKRFMTLLVNDLECAMFSWIILCYCRCETQRKKQLFFILSNEEVMRARFTSTARNSHQWNLSGIYLWSIECLSYTFHKIIRERRDIRALFSNYFKIHLVWVQVALFGPCFLNKACNPWKKGRDNLKKIAVPISQQYFKITKKKRLNRFISVFSFEVRISYSSFDFEHSNTLESCIFTQTIENMWHSTKRRWRLYVSIEQQKELNCSKQLNNSQLNNYLTILDE